MEYVIGDKIMNILDGKAVSNEILSDLKEKINCLCENNAIQKPSIAIVIVGNNPASETYVKAKMKACEKAGIEHKLIRFEETISNFDLYNEVCRLNQSHFDGFIVQLPLPDHIKSDAIIGAIDPNKDIDGFHPLNFGKMAIGQPSMRPATPYGILKLIQHYDIETKGKHVVVIGRSNLVGKPISIMLGNDFGIGRSTVTSCDINTPKELLITQTRMADIIIVAVGKPNLLTADMVKEGSVVIDVGINRTEDGKLVGDVDFDNVSKVTSWISPVPGGVGPMTVAGLILNTFGSWKKRNLIEDL
jgi:methylenetetrahydrofolate dehydrogenase (NADP+)/methenyltetrahydrofolate cyclohydrolase